MGIERFYDDAVRYIIKKGTLVKLIGEQTSLHSAPKKDWLLLGKCPIHGSESDTLFVDTLIQKFCCLECGVSGNIIDFYQATFQAGYEEAVEALCRDLKIDLWLEKNVTLEDQAVKRRETAMLRDSARYYAQNLKSAAGEHARDYLAKRGIDDRIIRAFGIGFAEKKWDGLMNHLEALGYTQTEMLQGGLIKDKDGIRDVFVNRILFPIINAYGSVIGFGGRTFLPEDNRPKYLNSSENKLFYKGRNVYGLNLVTTDTQPLILVEGYVDVINLIASGMTGVIASLGTSLTQSQARLIKQYADLVYIAYDGDTAGRVSAKKAATTLLSEDIKVKIVNLPDGLDPDEYIKEKGMSEFEKLFELAVAPCDMPTAYEDGKSNTDIIKNALLQS